LNALLGPGACKLLLMAGGLWSADEAVKKGLIDRIVGDNPMADAGILAAQLATFDTGALRASKIMVDTLSNNGNQPNEELQKMHDEVLDSDIVRRAIADFAKS
jgi:enoyl-CoA hydratase/carnithine racemase